LSLQPQRLPYARPIMFCSRCGAQVVEGNRFCQVCGQEIGIAIPAPVAGGTAPTLPVAPPGMERAPVSAPVYASVSAPLPYAGFWERVAAYLIDGLILGIPFGIVGVALIFMFGGFGVMLHRNAVDPREAMAILAPMFLAFFLGMLVFLALQWLYFAGMESSARQATVGKSVMALRVTNGEGQRISFGHATGRFFAKIVSGMVPFAIGYIMAAFTARKQALHDLIAGTLVLKK
jgi:uncharacterized RDD family membrane protein YckC